MYAVKLKPTFFYDSLRMTAFILLVTLMLLLALQISDTATAVLANAEPTFFNENFCYSACGFGP